METKLTLQIILGGIIALIGIGLYGLMIVRNLVKMVAVLQILVKGAVLALVVAGNLSGHARLSQSLAATVIVADTVVAVIGLAMAVQVREHYGTLDLSKINSLKG